jgi:hypothetical protein
MKRLIVTLAAMAALVIAPAAWAADGATLFGGATQNADGSVQLVSNTGDAATTNDFSGVSFPVPSGTTFGSLTTLSAQYNVTDDDCGGGSPRFQINVGGKNVFVYFGPSPSFTGCAQNTWSSTGNLVGTSDACRVDTSQLPGGKQCSTWAEAVALIGSQAVTGIQLVVDSGWFFADKEQTVLVRNVTINGTTFLTQPSQPGGGGQVNAAKLCKAQRSSMGSASAFNELWGTNANDRNAYGKCVSAVAHARNAGKTQQQILDAITACKAQGKSGAALGACVAATDGVAATKTEAQERAAQNKGKGKGKGKK